MRIGYYSFPSNEAVALYTEPSSRVSVSSDLDPNSIEESQGKDYEVIDRINPTLMQRAVAAIAEADVKNEDDPDSELSEDLSRLTEPKGADGKPLSEAEQQELDELEERDREVKAHEKAHLIALGSYATSGATYEYQKGPDGRQYAIGGHVNFSVSPGSTSEETIKKAQQIKRAALAPGDPSSTDMKVATQAAAMEMKSQSEVTEDESRLSDAKDIEGVSLTFGEKGAIDALVQDALEEDGEEQNTVQAAFEPVLLPMHVADALYQAQNLLQAPELIAYA